MLRSLKNTFSYLWFVFSMDWLQLVSTVIDVAILAWSACHLKEILAQPSLMLIVLAVFINGVWQVINVISHFRFLKKEDPKEPIHSMLKDGKIIFSKEQVERELLNRSLPYTVKEDIGILENTAIDAILLDPAKEIVPEWDETKPKVTRTYIRQYKETLLKFLNHKWHDVNYRRGLFTNDRKICFAGELYEMAGCFHWRICKGRYYNGYLTNFIYTQYVGTHYALFAPMNIGNTPIRDFVRSDFSDHIGISTLLYTKDGYIILFQQSANAGYNAEKMMPSGSGSLDYADFRNDRDLRRIITRGAERELGEETSINKTMTEGERQSCISTTVLRYYRDMARGGKPEFCCISRIDMPVDYVAARVKANTKELVERTVVCFPFNDHAKWQSEILPKASLSLKMNYEAVKSWLVKSAEEASS